MDERPTATRRRPRHRRRLAGFATVALALALTATSCVVNGTWATTAPLAPATSPLGLVLADVSCPTADFCMAVATDTDSGVGGYRPFVQTWDGEAWSEVGFTPDLPTWSDWSRGATANGVSCSGPTTCAVSWNWEVDDESVPSVSVWDDGTWTQGPFVDEVGATTQVVACAPDGGCVFAASSGSTIVWDGDSFESFAVSGSYLADLACSSVDHCVGLSSSVARTWNGSTWTSAPLPAGPVGSITSWTSLDCTGPVSCLAVGGSRDGTGWSATTARFDGATWSVVATPLVEPAVLSSISCATWTACVALGTSVEAGTTIAMGWNGVSWYRLDDPPQPPGSRYLAIGCAEQTCLAVGATTTAGVAAPLASTYAWAPLS